MIQALLGVVGVLVGVIGGYLTARLKNSGKINTTEATTLWEQSSKMRQELTERAAALELELARQKVVHDDAMARMFTQLEAADKRWDRATERLDIAYEEIRQLKERLR